MRIAVVGGGFTGLSCALELLNKKYSVVVFESESSLGGLAGGFNGVTWSWSLEYFYHHVFTNDKDIIGLAREVGWPVQVMKPVTTSFIDGREIQLDSPHSMLKFSKISFWGRIRMGAGLFILKMIPNGLFLEKYRVVKILPKLIGEEGYKIIWEKLLKAKFGPYAETVNMAWFWTRVAKRTKRLGYFEKGFSTLAKKIGDEIKKKNGEIRLNKEIGKIDMVGDKWEIDGEVFDGLVMTCPAPVTEKLLNVKQPKIDYLWGQTLVLELSNKLISGYWMNILEKDWPFLVAVEHTNMIDKKHYGRNRLVYLGNYLPNGHKQLEMNKEKLLGFYLPYLRKINKKFSKKWIKNVYLSRKPFSQPVFPINFSKEVPKIRTSQKGLYIANMSMVYPFDRGTNYAVKMGVDVAKMISKDLR